MQVRSTIGGNTYVKEGNFIQALSDYNKAIEIKPSSPEIYISLGNIFTKQGNFTQALSNYNKAIKIYPGYADAYYNRGIFFCQIGNFTQANDDLYKAKELGEVIDTAIFNTLHEELARDKKS